MEREMGMDGFGFWLEEEMRGDEWMDGLAAALRRLDAARQPYRWFTQHASLMLSFLNIKAWKCPDVPPRRDTCRAILANAGQTG
jgi:hypothetical protein